MVAITHKRGDTLALSSQLMIDGDPVAIGGWSIRSHVRDASDRLIEALTPTVASSGSGIFAVKSSGTANWPLGVLFMDIQLTDAGGFVRSTETLTINVTKDITQ